MTKSSNGTASKESEDRSSVRSVQRALDLLGCFATDRSRLTLTEAMRLTGLPASTTSRLLATLEQSGFLRKSSLGGYACGDRLFRISLNVLKSIETYEAADEELRALTELSGESSFLGIRHDEQRAIYVRQILTPRAIRHSDWLGRLVPIKGTAIGQALSNNVKPKGYAATRRTLEPDVTAIAAPIHAPGGEVVAAISLAGPSYRITDNDIAKYGKAALAAASEISKKLLQDKK